MSTTFEQELAREQAAVVTAEQIKDNIKTVAENKGLTVEETDTPLSVLTKIDNGTIATPTETISITQNGTVDVTNYASANVNVLSGDNKFKQMVDGSLTTVTTEDLEGITKIRNSGFDSCYTLIAITIPKTVTLIGSYCFQTCTNLQTVNFETNSQLQTIGGYAFYGCRSLTTITIPKGVTNIYYYAFAACRNLATMRVEAITPPTLQSNSLDNTALTQIEVPMASVDTYKTATNWTQFADIIVGYTE